MSSAAFLSGLVSTHIHGFLNRISCCEGFGGRLLCDEIVDTGAFSFFFILVLVFVFVFVFLSASSPSPSWSWS